MARDGSFISAVPANNASDAAATKQKCGAVGLPVLLLGSLLVISAAVPAVGQSPASAVAQSTAPGDAVVQTAGEQTADGGYEAFRTRVKDELADWGRKMHGFDEHMKASGRVDTDAAVTRVRAAWSDTEAEGRKVQAATGREWEGVKESYEMASHELAVAWEKIRP